MHFRLNHPHAWDLSIEQAKTVQTKLASKVILEDTLPKTIEYVAGTDVGFEENGKTTRAAVVILEFNSLELIDSALIKIKTTFPYIPGYLSFREIPALLKAFEKIKLTPDIILCDGQGIAHPRRLGIASHLGVLLDLPTIGVAKSRLIGTYNEPGMSKGNRSLLYAGKEKIGYVLRTRENVKPLFISPGHKISIQTACDIVIKCTTKYRLPETTRQAHNIASNLK
ncbi:MAG: deoxyribonuclease V [Thioalkalispiraceae bacterium]|jgi:deoxyribonuclease V